MTLSLYYNQSLPKVILRRGPRRGTVAHVCRKVPVGYNGAPQIRPKSTPSRGPIPNPTTCLIPGPVRPMMPNGIRIRSTVFYNALDRPMHRPTDRPRESLITIDSSATRATRPNNSIKTLTSLSINQSINRIYRIDAISLAN